MSISSCPRCSQHVTLPEGVDHHVRVRCPLCQAQYTLAEALANAPPLLEVVIEVEPGADAGAGWHEAVEQPAQEPLAAAEPPVEFAHEPALEFDLPVDEIELEAGAGAAGVEETIDFERAQLETEDLTIEEKDTEVEDIFRPSEPHVHEPVADTEPLDLTGPGEEPDFSFDEPAAPLVSNEASLEPSAQGESEEIELDFGGPMFNEETVNANDATVEFNPADISAQIERGAPAEEDMALDFGEPVEAAPAEDDLVPDFGEPIAAETATPDFQPPEEPLAKGKKEKKKKEKKEKKKKETAAADGEKKPRKRSLVGALVNIVLPGLIVIPFVLYGAIWLDPAYDILGIGSKLPSWAAPASFKKKQIAKAPIAPPATMPVATTPPPAEPQVEPAEGQPEAPAGTPATPDVAAAEPTTPATPEVPAEAPPDAAAPEPTDTAAAPAATTKEEPAKTPAEEPAAADPLDSLAAETAKPTEPAAEEPAGGPSLAPKATPDAADMPEEPAEKPAESAEEPAKPAAAPSSKPEADATDSLDNLLDANKPDEKPAATPAEPAEVMPAEEPLEPQAELGPRGEAEFGPKDVSTSMQEAMLANQKLVAAQAAKNEAQLKTARKDFYLSLYSLGNVVALAKDDTDQPKLDPQRKVIEQLALQMAADPKRLEALRTNAARWLAFGKRTTQGIVLAGTVQDVEQAGKLYYVKLEVAPATEVTVVCEKDPKLAPRASAMILGTIVEHPEQDLAGYEGTDVPVVWSGMTLELPASDG